MAQPTENQGAAPAPAGRAKMTPSERARHASLVRWGKEQPFAARLAAVRERRKAKKKAGGGKGKVKKPALTPEQKQAAKDKQKAANVASVGDALAAQDAALSKNGLDGLAQAAAGTEPGANVAEGLIKQGLAERGADGRYRLSSDGKAVLRAAQAGDVNGTLDALSRNSDKLAKQAEKETGKEPAAAGGGGGGGGKKPSEQDKKDKKAQEREQTAKETAAEVGVDPADLEQLRAATDTGGAASDALTELGLIDAAGDATDQGRRALLALERGDVRQYRAALQDAAARLGREGASAQRKGEQEKAKQARTEASAAREAERTAARTAREEARAARKQRQNERLARLAKRGGKLTENQKADLIDAGLAEEDDRGVFRLKDSTAKKDADMDYAAIEATLTTLADDLAADADLEVKAGKRHSASDQAMIQAIYDAAEDVCELACALGAEEGGDDEGYEEAEAPIAAKADEEPFLYGSEIKALAGDTIGGYAVLFGTEETPDLSSQRDYFTKSTDYWLERFGWPRPMTYHHGMDPDTRDDPIVGTWTEAKVDDVGVWLEGQLDKAHRYHGAVKELIRRGFLKLSSDSAPQWVVRERKPNGAHEVKRWPLISASPTVTPAEPRLSGLSFKALLDAAGVNPDEVIDTDSQEASDVNSDRHDGAKAASERARALLLELDILALETAQ